MKLFARPASSIEQLSTVTGANLKPDRVEWVKANNKQLKASNVLLSI